MNKLLLLIKGEFLRLTKYHVTTVSLLVAFMWFIILYVIDSNDLLMTLLPFVIIIDATMMSVIFIGSVMFFEKTEQTMTTMLVTPVSDKDLILSKAITNTLHSVMSTSLVILAFYILKDIEMSWLIMIPSLILSVFMHSMLGFVFSYHSKDFTSMLVNVMVYALVVTIPVVLYGFGIILQKPIWDYILLVLPTQSSIKLIEIAFNQIYDFKFFLAIIILLTYAILGYFLYVKPKFKHYAVKQSGV